jgi:hypothetical protein
VSLVQHLHASTVCPVTHSVHGAYPGGMKRITTRTAAGPVG